jgi:hypothetical protein
VRNMPDVLNKPAWSDKDLKAGMKVKQTHPLAGLSTWKGYGAR